jgi:hypothetical protein
VVPVDGLVGGRALLSKNGEVLLRGSGFSSRGGRGRGGRGCRGRVQSAGYKSDEAALLSLWSLFRATSSDPSSLEFQHKLRQLAIENTM